MKPYQWTNEEIKMLQILGAIIGGVIGLILSIIPQPTIGDSFPWQFIALITGVVGAIIGAFNRAPANSCVGAMILGAIFGSVAGITVGLMLGALYWFTFWPPVTDIAGSSWSRVISGVGLGIAAGAFVIDPRPWQQFWTS